MPETLTDRYRCHKCDKIGKRKKLSKCERCHAVTYCSRECQREDWARHKENCIPVMVKEYEGKGLGLVAARAIKMGELILTDKAMMSDNDFDFRGYCYDVTHEAERLLLNQRILKDISLLNHSCDPNAAMGLLDGEKNREPEKRFELRAIKNIAKDDEVSIFYPSDDHDGSCFLPHAGNRALIKKCYGFDCRCVVCLRQVPNQDDVIKEIHKTLNNKVLKLEEETLQNWKRRAIVLGILCDLAKPLYIGRQTDKMTFLVTLFGEATKSGNSVLRKKALDEMRELVDRTGLEIIKNAVETLEACECDRGGSI